MLAINLFVFSEIEDYKAVVLIGQKKTRKAKIELEFKLATIITANKKGFLKYVTSKRWSKESSRLILLEDSIGQAVGLDDCFMSFPTEIIKPILFLTLGKGMWLEIPGEDCPSN